MNQSVREPDTISSEIKTLGLEPYVLQLEVDGLRIGILTGMFEQSSEYRNRSVACLLHERVKPLCKAVSALVRASRYTGGGRRDRP